MRSILMFTALLFLALPARAETIHVSVDGLVCAFCASGLEKAFGKHPATETVTVDMDNKLVTVITKQKAAIDDAVIRQTVTDAGYNVTGIHRQK